MVNLFQDDPYFGEIAAWIDTAEAKDSYKSGQDTAIADDDESSVGTGQTGEILSSFRDACGTYALTWRVASDTRREGTMLTHDLRMRVHRAIKEASERSLKTKRVH